MKNILYLICVIFLTAACSAVNGDKVSKLSDSDIKALKLARSDWVTPGRLADFACHANPNVRLSVAKNPITTVKTLERLSCDPVARVRAGVAKNSKTPETCLTNLSGDPSAEVIRAVAHNPSTPGTVLDQLADISDDQVHEALCKNPSTSSSSLGKMAKIGGSDVRLALAWNHNTPPAVLEDIYNHPSDDRSLAFEFQKALFRNPNTPLLIREKLRSKFEPAVEQRTITNHPVPLPPETIADREWAKKWGGVWSGEWSGELPDFYYTGDLRLLDDGTYDYKSVYSYRIETYLNNSLDTVRVETGKNIPHINFSGQWCVRSGKIIFDGKQESPLFPVADEKGQLTLLFPPINKPHTWIGW